MNEKLTKELKSLLLIILAKDSITSEQKERLCKLIGVNTLTIKIVDE